MHQDDGKSIALVLGAGGARGLAHIGVIEELQARINEVGMSGLGDAEKAELRDLHAAR